MGRTSTKGSLEWVGDPDRPKSTDHWRVRVTVGKSRRWVNLPSAVTRAQEKKARVLAMRYAALALAGQITPAAPAAPTPAPTGETLLAWADRWFASRTERGLRSTRTDKGRFTTWVLLRLGDRPVAAITTADIEAWVEWIDGEVRAGRLAWKTAGNAWGLLSKAMADAARGKVKALRCRADNPCAGVSGPDRGVARSKPYLFPSEFLALVRCEVVPLEVRRAYAVTVYLFPRAGEVEALHWEDLDLEHGTAHIHRASDPDTGLIREVKGKAARRFEIEPELLPLLRAMRAERPKAVRVFEPWPLLKHRAGQLREALQHAGVKRAELLRETKTRKHLTFHDLRATGTTWAAIRGDEPLRIMHRAGHKDLQTTMGYVREAENVRRSFGTVFPPLPTELLGDGSPVPRAANSSQDSSHGGGPSRENAWKRAAARVPGEGFELSGTGASGRDAAEARPSDGATGAQLAPPDASDRPAGTNPGTSPGTALRAAIDAALDAGDHALAAELLTLLRGRAPAPVAPVVTLDAERRQRAGKAGR